MIRMTAVRYSLPSEEWAVLALNVLCTAQIDVLCHNTYSAKSQPNALLKLQTKSNKLCCKSANNGFSHADLTD